jgi:hypothetical protein
MPEDFLHICRCGVAKAPSCQAWQEWQRDDLPAECTSAASAPSGLAPGFSRARACGAGPAGVEPGRPVRAKPRRAVSERVSASGSRGRSRTRPLSPVPLGTAEAQSNDSPETLALCN